MAEIPGRLMVDWKGKDKMLTCKGIVRKGVVVLQPGAQLPDGAEVEVRLVENLGSREEAFARLEANRIHRYVGMDEIIEEEKRELEERPDRWLSERGS
jgi:hypothetical protein